MALEAVARELEELVLVCLAWALLRLLWRSLTTSTRFASGRIATFRFALAVPWRLNSLARRFGSPTLTPRLILSPILCIVIALPLSVLMDIGSIDDILPGLVAAIRCCMFPELFAAQTPPRCCVGHCAGNQTQECLVFRVMLSQYAVNLQQLMWPKRAMTFAMKVPQTTSSSSLSPECSPLRRQSRVADRALRQPCWRSSQNPQRRQ